MKMLDVDKDLETVQSTIAEVEREHAEAKQRNPDHPRLPHLDMRLAYLEQQRAIIIERKYGSASSTAQVLGMSGGWYLPHLLRASATSSATGPNLSATSAPGRPSSASIPSLAERQQLTGLLLERASVCTLVPGHVGAQQGSGEGSGGVSEEGAEPCCICLDPMQAGQTVRMLACTHRMHGPCLQQWVARRAEVVCPLCKQVSRV
mmetsp:Transcript_3813/g.8162  ORF Transcript_3813/g.8162 Transcript_3813/m.8162 type:complete len:205 (-) Transcript_3813:75-689(-)